jgi:high-affinity iron transporter
MGIRSQIAAKSALIALLVAPQLPAQEAVGKRLSAIVGVAVEEYAKGVDSTGRLTSALELEEANGFLKEARDVASRLKGPTAAPARALIDSLALAAAQRVRPGDLRAMYGRFTTALGDAGALDLPTRAVDIARGQMVFTARCAACHGATGAGIPGAAPVPPGAPVPPAIGTRAAMQGVSPALAFRIVSVGIQGTPMVGMAGILSVDERWDVVAYLNALRASDAERARGRAILESACGACDGVRAKAFAWQAALSDSAMAAMLLQRDTVTGIPLASAPTGADAAAVVAALRAAPELGAGSAAGVASTTDGDAPAKARAVLRMLDDAVVAARTGRVADGTDLAFDAYIAFEPLETNVRMRDPGLVARLERQFADFHGALKAGDLTAAEANRSAIEQAMPRVIELTEPTTSPWGSFLESFVIILREGFEAILVIGAVVAFLIKTGHRQRVRDIWLGSAAGLGASLVLAFLLRTVLAAVPASGEIIEGATLLVAVVVLFSVSYWLLSKVESARWQQFIREQVSAALSKGGSAALGFVAFLAVFREGAETALFFQALLAKQTGSGAPIFAGIAAGGATLAVIFSLFHRFGVRIPLRPFFAVTSGLLYWMAFVFAGKGIKELQEGHAVSRTVLPGFPTVEAFGMYPTVETIIAQGVLVALLLFALWRSLRPSGDVAAEAEAPAEPISPEVASRLAELQATARRLQDRVVALEKEVEHESGSPGERRRA